jgi:hypothetical protein
MAAATRPASRDDEIMRLFAEERHDQVVVVCSAGPVSAERAPVCFMAACRIRDEARARKLITAVPAASRDALIAQCQGLGVDVKKSTRPAVDCEADPMACRQ